MKKRKYYKIRSAIFTLGLITVVVLFFILLDSQIRPVIVTIANYQSHTSAVLAINESVTEELQNNPQLYDNLLVPQYNSDGEMVALNANTLLINEAKANLTEVVAESLQQMEERTVSIPIGTLFGWQLLAGMGPRLHFSVIPASYVESDIITHIETAGINQTKNSIYMRFNVTVSAIIPGYTSSVDVKNDVLIADFLVVGETPVYYGSNTVDNFLEPEDML